MDENAKENLSTLAIQLDTSQNTLEQDAFGVLNRQDTECGMLSISIDKLMEIIAYSEGIEFEFSEIIELMEQLEESESGKMLLQRICRFLELFDKEQLMLQQLGLCLGDVMKYHNDSSDVVHSMENDIADQRSCLDKLFRILRESGL